jgi:nucleoside 2-deoxyribosyltransferase
MKIYVAAKFEERTKVQRVYEKLRSRGHTITHDWTNEDAEAFKNVPGYAAKCAQNDFDGVKNADAVLLFNHDRLFGGASEMGIALATDVPVYVVGREIRENIFFNMSEGISHFVQEDDAIHNMEIDYAWATNYN